MPLALLPLLLLVMPIVEIATFILVGRGIGLWPTLGLVVVSAVAGALLLRRQGLATLRRIQAEISAGRVPGRELVDGVAIVAAAILLLTPGLVTDAIGYLLFVPPVRDALWRFLRRRVRVSAPGSLRRGGGRPGPDNARRNAGPATKPPVVELGTGDYERRRADDDTPWRGPHEGNRTLH